MHKSRIAKLAAALALTSVFALPLSEVQAAEPIAPAAKIVVKAPTTKPVKPGVISQPGGGTVSPMSEGPWP